MRLLACLLAAMVMLGALGCGKKDPPGVRLVQAVRDNKMSEVDKLLAQGVDPNSKDSDLKDARTALYHAAVFGYTEIAKKLLEKGATVDLGAPETKQTPLMIAAFNENRDMVILLLGAGAQVNAQDPAGDTPLTQAARRGNAELIALLVNAGADVGMRTGEGLTALCLAKQSNFTAAVQMLEKAGSPPEC
ncbi:MAG: ankyrin repeat domain-containing protein [Burkholderiales bacterium]